VLDVFPDSRIVENRVDKYPIQVVVEAKVDGSQKRMEVWKGRQQDLFRKYAAKRSKAIEDIKSNLQILMDDLDEEEEN